MGGHFHIPPLLDRLITLFGYDEDIRFEANGVTYELGKRTLEGAKLHVGNEQNRVVFRLSPSTVSHPVFEKFMEEAVKWACGNMERQDAVKEVLDDSRDNLQV